MQDNIYDSLKEWKDNLSQYVNTRIDLFKLEMAHNMAHLASSFISKLVLLYFLLLALFFMSMGFSFFLGSLLDSNALGFFLTGVLFIIFMFIFYLLRRRIVERPVIKTFIRLFFQKRHLHE